MSKVAAHRKSTKAGIDLDEARRKREDNIIELRKSKRDESLQKKRQTFATPQFAQEDSTKAVASAGQRVSRRAVLQRSLAHCSLGRLGLRSQRHAWLRKQAHCHSQQFATLLPQLDELPLLVSGVFSSNVAEQFEATMRFRKLLSIGQFVRELPCSSREHVALGLHA